MYQHTILEPKTLTFEPEYRTCPRCHKRIQKHIFCNGARWHIHSYFGIKGIDGKLHSVIKCSEPDCEDNHGVGKCVNG